MVTSGCSAATAWNSRFHSPPAFTSTLCLCTRVTWPRRPSARTKASRMTRSTPWAVFTLTSVAISCGVPARTHAAVAAVEPLGALADHDEVDRPAAGHRVGQRGRHARVQLGRAQVDVVVEGEAQLQQQAALEQAAGDRRGAGGGADRAEDDRLGWRASSLQHRIGQHLAGALPALGAEVVVDEVEGVVADDGGEDLQALGDDLRADAVAGDDGDDGLADLCCAHPREATWRSTPSRSERLASHLRGR